MQVTTKENTTDRGEGEMRSKVDQENLHEIQGRGSRIYFIGCRPSPKHKGLGQNVSS